MSHRFKATSLVYMIMVLLLVLITTACSSGGEKKPTLKKEKGPKIGVSVADMQRDGNKTIKQVFDKFGKKDKAKITWLDAKGDPVQQQKDIQKLIEEKVKVVILQVTDPAIGPGLVKQLAQNNIKVIALETLPENTPVDGYITSDHSRTGYLQVRYLETLLQQAQQQIKQGKVVLNPQPPTQTGQQGQGQGQQQGQQKQQMIIPAEQQAAVALQDGVPMRVVVLQGDSKDQMAKEITAAVNSALQNLPSIDAVMTAPHPRWDANLVKSTMQQLLATDKKIDAVLANDSSMAMAAVEVLKQLGIERRVITVGAGADPKAIKALISGEHDAEVDNRPDMLASLAYEEAKALAEGKAFSYDTRINNGDYTVPARIVPPRLIQQENVYLLQERMGKKEQQQSKGQQQQGQNQQQQQQGQQQSQQNQQSQQQAQKKTTLKITTSEGKVIEVQIDGEVQSIESQSGGAQGGQGQQQGQQQQQQQQQGGQ